MVQEKVPSSSSAYLVCWGKILDSPGATGDGRKWSALFFLTATVHCLPQLTSIASLGRSDVSIYIVLRTWDAVAKSWRNSSGTG